MFNFFDFEMLRVIWWAILGVLFIGFAITDGFDLGVAILFPFIGRTESEKQIILSTIKPFWEGNQVWMILGAGAIFAAWPMIYAAAFSSFYLLILLLLLTLGISRPVSFKYRNKLPNPLWREIWDKLVFIGGLGPAFIFGVLVANILTGIPFAFDESLRLSYSGNFFSLFHPFAIWCGFMSISLLVMHGGLYLSIKTEAPIAERATYFARFSAIILLFLFIAAGCWVTFSLKGYVVTSFIDHLAPSNPLQKNVIQQIGAWANNFFNYPILWCIPALFIMGTLFVFMFATTFPILAFIASCFAIIGIITTFGVGMFPFILPSSSDFSSSLLVFDASSSHMTLLFMLFAVILFLPIILVYTAWVYRVMRGKVRAEDIELHDQNHSGY